MKQKLVASIRERIENEIDPRNPVKFLSTIPLEEIVEAAISVVYLYTRVGKGSNKTIILLAGVISAIGHNIRNKFNLKRDSSVAAKAGSFLLYSFDKLGIISVTLGAAPNGHATYIVKVENEEELCKLWETLVLTKTEKLPSLTPYAPWVTTKHEMGAIMVKTESKEVLESLNPETHPLVFECLNKAQRTGWRVNEDIYNVYTWALRNKTDAFSEIWDMQNPEAKQSKIREANAIGGIAKRFIGKVFYHLYYYDFRGRKYPATAYYHEQGTDLAKGLLLRDDEKEIGESGFNWLLISIASNWAGESGRSDGYKTDKIPLKDRVEWALDNQEILLSYAISPKVNQGWMKADKPWQFLAACIEWYKATEWELETSFIRIENGESPVSIYDYKSHIECFIDGSNNGSQHLSALTKDEVTAPHVNLVPLDLPGDLYKYVADHVWEKLEFEFMELTDNEVALCDNVIDTLTDIKRQIHEAPIKSDRRKELIEQLKDFRKVNELVIKIASVVFWMRVKDAKHKRKVVKRNVMTLPLIGGSKRG